MRNRIIIAAVIFASPALAEKSIDDVEACWSKTRNISGAFTQELQDDSVGGSFTINHPGSMQLDFAKNFGARWTIGNGLIQQSALDQHGRRKLEHSEELGPFASVFSMTPDFSKVSTGTGDAGSHTVIRARHPNARRKGYVDFYFRDKDCRLTQWVSTIEGFEHTTTLNYGKRAVSHGGSRPQAASTPCLACSTDSDGGM